jgi:hypothetical protein
VTECLGPDFRRKGTPENQFEDHPIKKTLKVRWTWTFRTMEKEILVERDPDLPKNGYDYNVPLCPSAYLGG